MITQPAKQFEPVIGLEVHVQLNARSKIFCNCSTRFGAEPNSQTCPVCLGMPGVLPVLNRQAVEHIVRMGLAVNCSIRRLSRFARKNYFYPDLPKGYQISQFDEPFCVKGEIFVESDGQLRRIGITRIHLEEDAGKSVHDEDFVDQDESLVDLNRCGMPLIEIVSEPDLRSPREAAAYLMQIRQLARYLGVSDGNMEEGSLRCDANVSIRQLGTTTLGVRTELKNMNSFSHVEKAIRYEIDRQIHLVSSGGVVEQETLLWDPSKNQARSMRGKEESHDYRYFPEPDLPPVVIDSLWLEEIRRTQPELPEARKQRFIDQFQLSLYDAGVLTASREIADYFESLAPDVPDYKLAANWLMGEVARALNETNGSIADFPVTPSRLAALIRLVAKGEISHSAAKKVFDQMLGDSADPEVLIEKLGLKQVGDVEAIAQIIDQVLDQNPAEVQEYRNGKTKLISFFVGQVMRASKGKANPAIVNEILARKLS
jgi:aspartyl-tRNA(Asn)/glutamyl-tRNA(Gln) amidotransferase subunit B